MLLSLNCSYRSQGSPASRCPSGLSGAPVLICRRRHDVLVHGGPRIATVEQAEMSKWTVILLLVHRPFFKFNQTMVGPFYFLQYLLCMRISFAVWRVDAHDSQLRRTHATAS